MRCYKNLFGIGIGLISAAMTGCVNMSSHQTAEVLKPNESRTLIGGGYFMSEEINAGLDEASSGEVKDIKFPYLEMSYRRGIIEKLDVGAKLTIIGTIAGDAKYQLFNNEKFAAAAGAGLGYLSMSSGEGESKIESKIIDLMVPFYTSYRMAENFALYLTPQYVYRNISSSDGDKDGTSLIGSTLGMMIGKTAGMTLEATMMKAVGSDFDMIQAGLGFFW
jgi:hypothetical protein